MRSYHFYDFNAILNILVRWDRKITWSYHPNRNFDNHTRIKATFSWEKKKKKNLNTDVRTEWTTLRGNWRDNLRCTNRQIGKCVEKKDHKGHNSSARAVDRQNANETQFSPPSVPSPKKADTQRPSCSTSWGWRGRRRYGPTLPTPEVSEQLPRQQQLQRTLSGFEWTLRFDGVVSEEADSVGALFVSRGCWRGNNGGIVEQGFRDLGLAWSWLRRPIRCC